MNLLELKKACDENLTVINSVNQEIKILFVGEKSILAAKLNFSKDEYKVARNEHYISDWKLKPVTKKYYLWKYKKDKYHPLIISDVFLCDDYKNTQGNIVIDVKSANYKEKIESTMHEE